MPYPDSSKPYAVSFSLLFSKPYLGIARRIGDRRGECIALGNLGLVHKSVEQHETAIAFQQQALEIARAIGDRRNEGYALGNLGISWTRRQQFTQGLEKLLASLDIMQEIGNQSAEAEIDRWLAQIYFSLGNWSEARDRCQRAIVRAQALQIPLTADVQRLWNQIERKQPD